ncbi:peptidase T [Rodentibacter haemolyticus]|uniref:Peptidase T n=1 Tax=Rodentibacter haemolyticus TaxID=2778911 RepID=A0ABX6UZW6_9PAST|nr:peptidase T [Rodentibacter haemolyticus]QPB43628.1 peptidase T [Rodentibacter haemolyticus]
MEMNNYKNNLLNRFLHYLSFDTQSKPNAKHSPSSVGQMKLAQHLQKELIELGLQEVNVDKHAIVTAYLPSNRVELSHTIGFIAHLDTSPECSGKNVQAEVIENYRGGDIALGIGEEFISPVYYPFMHQLIGKTLIVTDGNTLLGADNKAGIAEIMTALEIIQKENLPHCNLRIAFTPDEEIGLGMQYFPIENFSCDWAYTIDGGEVGELEYENFNAATAKIYFTGRSMHTGYAKGKMINALALACDFHQGFSKDEVPEKTSGKEGFFHLNHFSGDIEKAELHYLIRDFDLQSFEQRKCFVENWTAKFNQEKGLKRPVECVIQDSYENMYEAVQKVPQAITIAEKAMDFCGIKAIHKPIRGGTDGAFLSERGLPCPNIFTGGYNFHSKHELISLEGMEKAVEVMIEITKFKKM